MVVCRGKCAKHVGSYEVKLCKSDYMSERQATPGILYCYSHLYTRQKVGQNITIYIYSYT
jgi:hypothetical protein